MASMRRISPFVATLLLTLAFPAFAASGIVLPDLGPVDALLDHVTGEQDRQDAALPFDESSELFPSATTGGEPAAEFLTIKVGTATVVLKDVPLREWYAPYVRNIAELRLVSGYRDLQNMPTGFFGPNDPVTLEQMVKVIVLAAGIDPGSCALPPKNLTASGTWAAQYVSCAEVREWSVYSDSTADLGKPATREQVVVSVLQAFKREFTADVTVMPFTDVEKTGAFAPAIAQASADGVVSGYTDAQGRLTGMFGPTNNVTRAEFSKIVSIALQLYK